MEDKKLDEHLDDTDQGFNDDELEDIMNEIVNKLQK